MYLSSLCCSLFCFFFSLPCCDHLSGALLVCVTRFARTTNEYVNFSACFVLLCLRPRPPPQTSSGATLVPDRCRERRERVGRKGSDRHISSETTRRRIIAGTFYCILLHCSVLFSCTTLVNLARMWLGFIVLWSARMPSIPLATLFAARVLRSIKGEVPAHRAWDVVCRSGSPERAVKKGPNKQGCYGGGFPDSLALCTLQISTRAFL